MDTTTTTATTAATSSDAGARERLTHSLQQMVDEADHLLKNAQRTGSDQFNAARDKFELQLRHAKDELRRLEEAALDNAKRAARATDLAVHEHPYAAMGIAAGAGLLIGMLISRR
jgi:ElaB/YqjD/DUF883 family membrane-anchored ribosome-binding protein